MELAQLKYMLPRLSGQGTFALASRRRHRHARSRRNEAGDRPAPHRHAHQEAGDTIWNACAPAARCIARSAARFPFPPFRWPDTRMRANPRCSTGSPPPAYWPTRACSPRSIPPSRSITLPSRRRVLLSDTVGFVRNLPTTLIEAFRATLEEVADAALILHVVDASSDQAAQHVAEVFRVLGEIGASGTPQILVLNKADRLPPEEHAMPGDARRAPAGRGRAEPVDAGGDGQRPHRRRPRADCST